MNYPNLHRLHRKNEKAAIEMVALIASGIHKSLAPACQPYFGFEPEYDAGVGEAVVVPFSLEN